MGETAEAENDLSKALPILNVRLFVFGMTAMNVVNGMMILFIMCFFPLALMLIAGIKHPSIYKLHIVFVLMLTVGISFGLNVFFIGAWCLRGLFMSLNWRITVGVVLLAWHILLWFLGQADYLDVVLVTTFLAISSWDRLHAFRERY